MEMYILLAYLLSLSAGIVGSVIFVSNRVRLRPWTGCWVICIIGFIEIGACNALAEPILAVMLLREVDKVIKALMNFSWWLEHIKGLWYLSEGYLWLSIAGTAVSLIIYANVLLWKKSRYLLWRVISVLLILLSWLVIALILLIGMGPLFG